jgi:hypothetical protein
MSRVANKNGILAATRYCAAADCGSGEVASSPHRRFAYREPMPTARRATLVAATTRYWRSQPFAGVAARCHSRTRRFAHRVMAAVILRCQGAQHSERPFLLQPSWAQALWAVYGVRLRHVTAQQPIAGAAACNPLPHRTLTRTVTGVLLLAKGMAIRVVAFLVPHPAKPSARPCGT